MALGTSKVCRKRPAGADVPGARGSLESRRAVEAAISGDHIPVVDTFPWKVANKNDLELEFRHLKERSNELQRNGAALGVEHPFPHERTGNSCSDAFFQFERLRTKKGNSLNRLSSAWNYWYEHVDEIKKKCKARKRKNYSPLHELIFQCHPPGQFPVLTAIRLYQYFNSSKIFDPYAGWGDRCIAALATGVEYVGVDSNPKLMPLFKNMLQEFASLAQGSARIFVGHKSENVLKRGGAAGSVCQCNAKSSTVQHITGYKSFNLEECDLVFSSPPFWKTDGCILERYNECEISYQKFMSESLIPIVRKCLSTKQKACSVRRSGTRGRFMWVCLHLPDVGPMYTDLVDEFGECNLKLQFRARSTPARDDTIFCWNAECPTTWNECANPLKRKTWSRQSASLPKAPSRVRKKMATSRTASSRSLTRKIAKKVSIKGSMEKLKIMAQKGRLTCKACILLAHGEAHGRCGKHTRQKGCVGH